MQCLIFAIDEYKFALNIESIERVIQAVEVTPLPEAHLHVAGIINIEGSIAPVFDLRSILGLPLKKLMPSSQFIISKTASRMVVLIIDTVLEVVELVEDQVITSEEVVQKAEFNSVHALAKIQGDILLILNLEYFLALEEALPLNEVAATTLKNFLS